MPRYSADGYLVDSGFPELDGLYGLVALLVALVIVTLVSHRRPAPAAATPPQARS